MPVPVATCSVGNWGSRVRVIGVRDDEFEDFLRAMTLLSVNPPESLTFSNNRSIME